MLGICLRRERYRRASQASETTSQLVRSIDVKSRWQIAWDRFTINSGIVADINGRFIATLFYFTILMPFGLLSAIFMDPLRIKV